MATRLQCPLEITHVGILLWIDPPVGEEHGQAIDEELHDGARPAALGVRRSLPAVIQEDEEKALYAC